MEAECLTKLCLTPEHCRSSTLCLLSYITSATTLSYLQLPSRLLKCLCVCMPPFPFTLGPLPSLRSSKASLLCSTLLIAGLFKVLYFHALQNKAFSWLFSFCLCVFHWQLVLHHTPKILMLLRVSHLLLCCTISLLYFMHSGFVRSFCR